MAHNPISMITYWPKDGDNVYVHSDADGNTILVDDYYNTSDWNSVVCGMDFAKRSILMQGIYNYIDDDDNRFKLHPNWEEELLNFASSRQSVGLSRDYGIPCGPFHDSASRESRDFQVYESFRAKDGSLRTKRQLIKRTKSFARFSKYDFPKTWTEATLQDKLEKRQRWFQQTFLANWWFFPTTDLCMAAVDHAVKVGKSPMPNDAYRASLRKMWAVSHRDAPVPGLGLWGPQRLRLLLAYYGGGKRHHFQNKWGYTIDRVQMETVQQHLRSGSEFWIGELGIKPLQSLDEFSQAVERRGAEAGNGAELERDRMSKRRSRKRKELEEHLRKREAKNAN